MNTNTLISKYISKEIIVKGNIQEVYKRWTTKEGITKFLAKDCKIELKIGGAYEIYFDMDAPIGLKGSEDCKILSYLENRILSFTWNAPPHFPNVRNSSDRAWVVIEFEKIDEINTKVKLTHTGFRDGNEWNEVYQYFDIAWAKVMEWLRDSF